MDPSNFLNLPMNERKKSPMPSPIAPSLPIPPLFPFFLPPAPPTPLFFIRFPPHLPFLILRTSCTRPISHMEKGPGRRGMGGVGERDEKMGRGRGGGEWFRIFIIIHCAYHQTKLNSQTHIHAQRYAHTLNYSANMHIACICTYTIN